MNITANMIKEATHLALAGMAGMPAQDEFAKDYLDAEQGKRFRKICYDARTLSIASSEVERQIRELFR